MIAVRRLARAEWEKKLRHYGCYPAEGLSPLKTAEWWRWPWPGPPFTVPVDSEGHCDARSLLKLIADMARLAPPGWRFDDPFDL
jgi:hypothetical protein